MRDHSGHIQVNRFEAEKIILDNCRFSRKTEIIPLEEADGRVLAEDVYSKWDSPNCLTCCMDSVAVRWSDFEQGMPDTSNWEQGKQWQFANTGVGMPEGFDTAIVVEHVIFSDNDTKVSFDCMPSAKYAGTMPAGSRMKKGDLLLRKNTVLTPLLSAYLASGNNTEVSVIKKPRVVFIPTGNELVNAGIDIPKGRNIQSNSYSIAAKLLRWGAEPVVYDTVPDDRAAISEALHRAAGEADIVILNAGSSKGNDDWGIEMLEEGGKVFYHQTNHGPGHHSSFGVLDETPVIGISGPPGGASFTTDYYVYPAVMSFLNQETGLKRIKARLQADFSGPSKFGNKSDKGESRPPEGGEFYSVRQMRLVQADDGILEAFAVGKGGHPAMTDAEKADAYYLLPSWPGKEQPKVGDMIELELRP